MWVCDWGFSACLCLKVLPHAINGRHFKRSTGCNYSFLWSFENKSGEKRRNENKKKPKALSVSLSASSDTGLIFNKCNAFLMSLPLPCNSFYAAACSSSQSLFVVSLTEQYAKHKYGPSNSRSLHLTLLSFPGRKAQIPHFQICLQPMSYMKEYSNTKERSHTYWIC